MSKLKINRKGATMPKQEEEHALKFTNSSHIDSLKKQCSIVTLQSDPRGHFGKLFDHLRQVTGNYINVLLQISQIDPKDALSMVSKYLVLLPNLCLLFIYAD